MIDDWPLHQIPNLSTKVTVGACWQGEDLNCYWERIGDSRTHI